MLCAGAEAGVLAQDAHPVGARGEVRHILRERDKELLLLVRQGVVGREAGVVVAGELVVQSAVLLHAEPSLQALPTIRHCVPPQSTSVSVSLRSLLMQLISGLSSWQVPKTFAAWPGRQNLKQRKRTKKEPQGGGGKGTSE